MSAVPCSCCADTGSTERTLDGYLDCAACDVATERAELEQWAIKTGIRCQASTLWVIYQHGKNGGQGAKH